MVESKDYTKLYDYELDSRQKECLNKYLELEKEQENNLEVDEVKTLMELNKISISRQINKSKGLENIDEIISFASLAKPKNFELSTVEKLIGIFPNVRKVYLFYTDQSEEILEELKERLEKSRNIKKSVKVESIKIDIKNTSDIYKEVYGIIIDRDRNNILLDNTTGGKMVSDELTRVAVEEGIKIVTWQEQNIKWGDVQKRLPGTGTMHLNKAPERANYVSYRAANEMSKRYKFKEAARIYESINKVELMDLYDALGDTFNFDTLYDYENLVKGIEKSNLYNIKLTLKKEKEKLNELTKYMKIIKDGYYVDSNGIQINVSQDDLNKVYYGLLIHYIYNSTDSVEFSHMIYNLQNEDYEFGINRLISSRDKDIEEKDALDARSLEDLLRELKVEEELINNFYGFEVNDMFLNKVEGKISIEEHNLSIPSHKIESLEIKEIKGKKQERYRGIITALIESDGKLSKDDEITLLGKKVKVIEGIERESTNPSEMRKKFKIKVDKINNEIREKSLVTGLKKEIKNFIVYNDNYDTLRGLKEEVKMRELKMTLELKLG